MLSSIFASALPYEYGIIDISSRVFRAIKLLPPAQPILPGLSPTLRIEIIEIDSDEVIPYDALSYTWDVANYAVADRRVIVETPNGKRDLLIHRPLEDALLHFARDKVKHRPLFVDQISINQLSPSEKSHQVPLMREIYANSERVLVWLGTSTKSSDGYFDFLQDVCSDGILSRVMGPNVGHFPKVFEATTDSSIGLTQVECEDRDDMLSLVSKHGARLPIDGMTDVMTRPWFSRLWIIQEACLGHAVTIRCGSRSLCFDCFRAGVLFYSVYTRHWMINIKSSVPKTEVRRRYGMFELLSSFTRIFQERKTIHLNRKKLTLYDLVLKYSVNDIGPKIGASVPEDRIFGLMGMAEEDGFLEVIRSKVRYDQTAALYTETAGMMARQNVDVLCFSQFPKRLDGLPSWVPDWSMELKIPRGYANLSTPVFAAGGKGEAKFELDSNCLAVRGNIVDSIARLGQRSLRRNDNFGAGELIDYSPAKEFMDEIEEFLVLQNEIPHKRIHSTGLPFTAAFRLSDYGLSAKDYESTMESTKALQTAKSVYEQVYKVGQRMIDTERTVQSFRLSQMIRSIGVAPWYWVPASEVDSLYLCATDPVAAGKIWLEGATSFFCDMISLCASSAAVVGYSNYLRVTERFRDVKFTSANYSEALTNVGFDPALNGSKEMSTYTDNLYKNIGSRLYLTKLGYVGLGPPEAAEGDTIVVLNGSTVPHVLRPAQGMGEGGGDVSWKYVGEAYCDGIMDGELLSTDNPPDSMLFKIY